MTRVYRFCTYRHSFEQIQVLNILCTINSSWQEVTHQFNWKATWWSSGTCKSQLLDISATVNMATSALFFKYLSIVEYLMCCNCQHFLELWPSEQCFFYENNISMCLVLFWSPVRKTTMSFITSCMWCIKFMTILHISSDFLIDMFDSLHFCWIYNLIKSE